MMEKILIGWQKQPTKLNIQGENQYEANHLRITVLYDACWNRSR